MDKFDFTNHKLPDDHQVELLTILIEEASEVQQRASKIARFGATEIQPGQELTNVQRLSMEIGDLLEMIEWCKAAGLLESEYVVAGKKNKAKQLAKFMRTYPTI